MKYSKRDRADAIEALMTCAASWVGRRPGNGSPGLLIGNFPRRLWLLCDEAWVEAGSIGDGTVADAYAGAASLLDAGWIPE